MNHKVHATRLSEISKWKLSSFTQPGLTSIHRKCLIRQFHTSSVRKNACHTIFIQFLIDSNKTVWWKKPRFSFFEKNAYHTIPIYGNCMTGIFLMSTQKNFETGPKFFLFFFQPKIEFRTQTNIFRKKIFCMQNLIFCVHNVVLVTIILAFIFFWLNFFSSKTLKIHISFVWGVYICLDQCLIIWKFKNLKYSPLKNANTTEKLSEINLERKNQTFWFMEKHLSNNFHLWKNVYHRDFIQYSVRMALYGIVWKEVSHIWKLEDKKFRSSRENSQL